MILSKVRTNLAATAAAKVAGVYLPLAGGVMAGDIDMNGNALTLDAAKTSRIYSLAAGRWNLDAAGVNTLFSDQWRIFPQVEVEMGTEDLDFGGGSNMRMRWDTAEATPLMKIGVLRPLYIGPFGDVGQNRAAGTAPASGILWRASDTTFANHISSRHEGGNAYFNKGDNGGEFRWQIGGVSYIALDQPNNRVQMKKDLRFDVGTSLSFVGSVDISSVTGAMAIDSAAGQNTYLKAGTAIFLTANPTANELQCGRDLDIQSNDLIATSARFFPARTSASGQPTPAVGELRVWRDPDDNKTYLIYNDTDEGVRKSEMT